MAPLVAVGLALLSATRPAFGHGNLNLPIPRNNDAGYPVTTPPLNGSHGPSCVSSKKACNFYLPPRPRRIIRVECGATSTCAHCMVTFATPNFYIYSRLFNNFQFSNQAGRRLRLVPGGLLHRLSAMLQRVFWRGRSKLPGHGELLRGRRPDRAHPARGVPHLQPRGQVAVRRLDCVAPVASARPRAGWGPVRPERRLRYRPRRFWIPAALPRLANPRAAGRRQLAGWRRRRGALYFILHQRNKFTLMRQ